MVPCEPVEYGWLPAPVLQHLRRRLDEVALGRGATEAGALGRRQRLMEDVPEFMEERHHLGVAQKRRLRRRRLRKVRDYCADGFLVRAICESAAPAQCECGSVAVLVRP